MAPRRVAIAAMLLALACVTVTLNAQRRLRNDTLWVAGDESPVWGAPQRLQPDLALHGPVDAEAFGSIDCMAARPGGGVVVFDRRGSDAPRLLLLDAHGRIERTLGRSGAGPGEYGRPSGNCLAVGPDGMVAMLDGGNSRINRWSEDGSVMSSVSLGFTSGGPLPYLVIGRDNHLFVRSTIRLEDNACHTGRAQYGFIEFDDRGTAVRSLQLTPDQRTECPTRINDPFSLLLPTRWGAVLAARTDVMGFTAAGSSSPRVVSVRRPTPSMPLSNAEREQAEALAAWTAKVTGGMIPAAKINPRRPVLHSVDTDMVGRIWFVLGGDPIAVAPAPFPGTDKPQWGPPPLRRTIEQLRLGAFMADGRWLGELVVPVDVDASEVMLSFGRDSFWTVTPDRDGLPLLTRWRIP